MGLVESRLNVNIKFPVFPQQSSIIQIRGFISQQTLWRSLKPQGPHWQEQPAKLKIFSLNPPYDFDGECLYTSTSARLPIDKYLGPSTLRYTKDPLQQAHRFVLEIEVSDSAGQVNIVTLGEPLIITSVSDIKRTYISFDWLKKRLNQCFLLSEGIHLPKYNTSALPRPEIQPERPDGRFACACGFTIDQLIEREYEGILPEEKYEPPDIKSSEW